MTTDARRAELTQRAAEFPTTGYEVDELASEFAAVDAEAESRGIAKGRAEAAKLVDSAIERALRGKFTLEDWADVADEMRGLVKPYAKKGSGT